jgi:hypothetical protein
MNNKRFWVAASIIVVVIIVGFAFSIPHTKDAAKTAMPQNKTTAAPSISLHDSFKKGTHTITGSVNAPNACTIVTADAVVSGNASSTEKIIVQISMPADVGVCLQLPTQANFSVTVSAPAHLPIFATINGSEASTTAL